MKGSLVFKLVKPHSLTDEYFNLEYWKQISTTRPRETVGAGPCVLPLPRRRVEVQEEEEDREAKEQEQQASWIHTPGLVNIIIGVMETDRRSTGLVVTPDNILHQDIKKTWDIDPGHNIEAIAPSTKKGNVYLCRCKFLYILVLNSLCN